MENKLLLKWKKEKLLELTDYINLDTKSMKKKIKDNSYDLRLEITYIQKWLKEIEKTLNSMEKEV